jgi:uncharacterized membrane protein
MVALLAVAVSVAVVVEACWQLVQRLRLQAEGRAVMAAVAAVVLLAVLLALAETGWLSSDSSNKP